LGRHGDGRTRRAGIVLPIVAVLGAVPASAARAAVLPTGRPVAPAGRVTPLQSFPTGAAVSPDGKTVLTVAGPVIQGGSPEGPSSGVAVMAVDAATGQVNQNLNVDDAFQGVLYDRTGTRAYVSGGAGNTVHVFSVAGDGTLTQEADLATAAQVAGIALSRDGKTLWAAEPTANAVERIDVATGKRTKVAAPSPDRLALSPSGRTLYASDWRGRCVTAIPTDGGEPRCIRVGRHSTGVAVNDSTLLAAGSLDATLASISTGDERAELIDMAQVGRQTDAPNDVVLAPDGRTAYVSLGADNAVAVMKLAAPGAATLSAARKTKKWCYGRRHTHVRPHGHGHRHHYTHRHRRRCKKKHPVDPGTPPAGTPAGTPTPPAVAAAPGLESWKLAGLIPTGWYPTALALSPDAKTLHVVTARGLGHSAAATQPFVEPDPAATVVDGAYGTVGTLETIKLPDRGGLAAYTNEVRAYLRKKNPAGTGSNPLVAGRDGPVKHVIYVTRENKTYDSVLGDLHPGPGTTLAVWGQPYTPNMHALERQFIESQSFYYQGFASTVGHMWEDAGAVSDLYEHSQAAGTGAHTSHISDSWNDPENFPLTGTLTEQAWRAGLAVRTYDQETVRQGKLIPEELQSDPSVFPKYSQKIADAEREAGWEGEFEQFVAHDCKGELAQAYGSKCSLPDYEYVYFGGDHTTIVDQPGYPTIEAQIADNDYATGKLVDAVSHSPYWGSTLIVIIEDDPQGTGDHVSAYRGFVALASPYVKRGFISPDTHYDLTSAIAAIDRVLGLPPLTDYAATTRPLDEFFTDKPAMTPLFTADGSGVAANPFILLPGEAPKSDVKHGIYSFTEPDLTNPRVAAESTWRQMKGSAPPVVSAP
jgi:lactonase family protein with 7-bladed beta-propeller